MAVITSKEQVVEQGVRYVEYLQCTGDQFIFGSIVPDQGTRVVMDCQAETLAVAGSLPFGVRNSRTSNAFVAALTPTQVFYNFGAAERFANYTNPYERMTIDANGNAATFEGTETVTITLPAAAFAAVQYLVIGTAYSGSSVYKGAAAWNGKIYSCRIYQNAVLVANYRPCYDPDGVPAFYDTVSKTYNRSLGTADFIAGRGGT